MANRLRVRVYNVRFGDAILVTVPDCDPANGELIRRNILIDVGNSLNKKGGADHVFKPVVQDIVKQLRGRPLDLYVMTHEHLDHVQGLYYAERKFYTNDWLKKTLKVNTAWFTASAAKDYYDHHPEAKQRKLDMTQAYDRIAAHLRGRPASGVFRTLLQINNPRSTKDCVDYLRKLAPPDRTHYVHADLDVSGLHPFREARFEIWAPEEDTSHYYPKLAPMALEPGARAGDTAGQRSMLVPPSGVDTGAFYDLVEARSHGFADNMLAIDKAANNTSVVMMLEWRGWRLLFAADAEIKSWQAMKARGALKPVHYLKVSHHGSHNGTPATNLLNRVLPLPTGGKKKGRAVIPTWEGQYNGIPHEPTNKKLRARARLRSTLDENSRDSLYMDSYFTA
jgi:hypothetical protein